ADGLGFTGDLSTTTPEGYGYLYIALHDHIAATPYLVYQLNACDGGWVGGLTIGWVTPPTVATLVMDGARHVLDLRTIDDVNLVINFTFSTTLDMPIAYLTDDPNGDPLAQATPVADPVYYDVNFVTNGGTMVYSQLVEEDGKIDAVTCEKESYTATWYTDPECTTPYDFNAAVTSDLTLYAGWKITQGTSRVYAQISAGTTSTSTSADMRFVAAIDNVGFDEAGFVLVSYPEDYADLDAILVVDGTECNTMKTNTVWTSINAAGSVVTAADLGGKYIFALTVTNIPSKKGGFDINIGVKAYAKRGALVYYSNAKTYCVNDFLA
ncbi:MAG: InlB B-repeat-containing protein, partial [Clostridia bacterium]|nr:InlB B-repeat-containing protein [Clostridia bacterium]